MYVKEHFPIVNFNLCAAIRKNEIKENASLLERIIGLVTWKVKVFEKVSTKCQNSMQNFNMHFRKTALLFLIKEKKAENLLSYSADDTFTIKILFQKKPY